MATKKRGRPLGEFGRALAELAPTKLAVLQAGAGINSDVLGDAKAHARIRGDHLALARVLKANAVNRSELVRGREQRLQAIRAALADPARRLGQLSDSDAARHLQGRDFNAVSVATLRKDIAHLRKLGEYT